MPGKRVPFDEETWQRRSQFAGLFLAEVSGVSYVGEDHPPTARDHRPCLRWALLLDRPYRNPRSYVPQGILLLVLVREDPFGR